ncbi:MULTISPECIES: hypothetical protein [unclassified Luteimonas]
MNKLLASMALVACAALSGCAATVQRPAAPAAGMDIPVPATSRILLHVKGTPEMVASDGWQAFRAEWRSAMAATAAGAGREFVYLDTLPATFEMPGTLVEVTITDYRHVSTGARYGLGVMTGNARVEADAAFYVLPGRTLAGTREYSTSSSAWQGIFAAMTSKQVAAITEQMVQEIDSRE